MSEEQRKAVMKKVKCINAVASQGRLTEGCMYIVLQEDEKFFYLAGGLGNWRKDRFEEVN